MARPGVLRDDDEALEDDEWADPQDRDPARDRLIAKKNVERAYREANRHNAKAAGAKDAKAGPKGP